MQLDELKEAWAAHGARLERSLAIDERLLREMLLRKVRFALAPYALWRAFELALGAAATWAIVNVLAAHLGEPRYLVVVGALAVFAVALTALHAVLLVRVLRLDHTAPVTVLQRDVERTRLVEYRALKWALLGGCLFWLPVPIVLIEALSGAPLLARVDLSFLAANLGVGVVILVVGQVLSRRYVERADLGPRARSVVEAVSGRGLRKAAAHLAELAKFQGEETGS